MKASTKTALAAWQLEAARIRTERQTDANAFTTNEFAEAANMANITAYRHLTLREKQGAYRRSRKVVNGKLVAAWVECQP